MSRVVVIGAGLAGLSAARILDGEHDVIVVDKGRGPGGRMATRRIGDATLDHGAQFFTTHTAEFREVVQGWHDDGLAQRWFDGQVGPTGVDGADGHPRYRGVPTMNQVARHLAEGLDVRTSTQVTAVRPADTHWIVSTDGEDLPADAVLLTAPVPQSLALLDTGGTVLDADDRAALERVEYDPCIAVLAVLDAPPGLPFPGAVRFADGPIDWMADNQQKGTSNVPAVTIHLSAAFSRTHWETPDNDVIAVALGAAGLSGHAVPDGVQVHRWRYAKPVVSHAERSLRARGDLALVFAGDAFGGAAVEGAVLSGRAAARHQM